MKETFLESILTKKKVMLTFYSKEDQQPLTRKCAPMDYGPSRRAKDKSDRFHLWDYESDKKNHVLSLLPSQIIEIRALDESFEPSEFITWNCNWFFPRDWGKYS